MKRHRIRLAPWIALSIAICPRVGLADPPPEQFTVSFDGDAAIWNPFDGFEACESALGATLCLELDDVDCNGAGECVGEADFTFTGLLEGFGSGSFEGKARCR